MKSHLSTWLVSLGIGLSLCAASINIEAYQCHWQNGHRVCWQNQSYHHCRTVNGYWHHGYYHHAYRVCN